MDNIPQGYLLCDTNIADQTEHRGISMHHGISTERSRSCDRHSTRCPHISPEWWPHQAGAQPSVMGNLPAETHAMEEDADVEMVEPTSIKTDPKATTDEENLRIVVVGTGASNCVCSVQTRESEQEKLQVNRVFYRKKKLSVLFLGVPTKKVGEKKGVKVSFNAAKRCRSRLYEHFIDPRFMWRGPYPRHRKRNLMRIRDLHGIHQHASAAAETNNNVTAPNAAANAAVTIAAAKTQQATPQRKRARSGLSTDSGGGAGEEELITNRSTLLPSNFPSGEYREIVLWPSVHHTEEESVSDLPVAPTPLRKATEDCQSPGVRPARFVDRKTGTSALCRPTNTTEWTDPNVSPQGGVQGQGETGNAFSRIEQGKDFDVVENETRTDYIKRMSSDGTWGDGVTLQALSNVLGVKIRIVNSLSLSYWKDRRTDRDTWRGSVPMESGGTTLQALSNLLGPGSGAAVVDLFEHQEANRDYYLLRLKRPREWGDEFTLQSMSNMLGAKIRIVNSVLLAFHVHAYDLENPDSYLLRLKRPGAWGDEFTLQAIANMEDVCIQMVSSLTAQELQALRRFVIFVTQVWLPMLAQELQALRRFLVFVTQVLLPMMAQELQALRQFVIFVTQVLLPMLVRMVLSDMTERCDGTICAVCNKREVEGDEFVGCSTCSSWTHFNCTGLDDATKSTLRNTDEQYHCINCHIPRDTTRASRKRQEPRERHDPELLPFCPFPHPDSLTYAARAAAEASTQIFVLCLQEIRERESRATLESPT
ncbi:PHD finger protein 6 [Branchiostoma belcheri]|nr:PHD finger protein 6 [Branchiostoma belcheri]